MPLQYFFSYQLFLQNLPFFAFHILFIFRNPDLPKKLLQDRSSQCPELVFLCTSYPTEALFEGKGFFRQVKEIRFQSNKGELSSLFLSPITLSIFFNSPIFHVHSAPIQIFLANNSICGNASNSVVHTPPEEVDFCISLAEGEA